MNDRTLLIRELDDVEKKDGAYVKQKIDEYLEEFGLSPYISNITFVTDRGSNMVSSLRFSNRIHCFAHLINNTVGKMLKDLPCVKAATAIVAYFKKSGKNKFSTTLKSNVSTRWNSVYYMLDSILKHWAEICDVLRANKAHLDDLNLLCFDELDLLRTFLQEFKKASMELEGSNYPTLYLVNAWYESLLQHMTPKVTDPRLISRLKRIGLEYWSQTVRPYLTPMHDIATFLHPMMKGLKAHTAERRVETLDAVARMLEKFGDSERSRPQTANTTELVSSAMRLFVDNDSDTEESELDKYKKLKVKSITNLLQWWEDKKTIYRNLYKIARYVHSIPASSASAERIFSAAGILCGNRPNMSSEKMDEILFLKSNYDLLIKLKQDKLSSEANDESDGYVSDTPSVPDN